MVQDAAGEPLLRERPCKGTTIRLEVNMHPQLVGRMEDLGFRELPDGQSRVSFRWVVSLDPQGMVRLSALNDPDNPAHISLNRGLVSRGDGNVEAEGQS